MSKDPHQRLIEARTEAGYTSARQAAVKFGWNYSTYASHESGDRGFRFEHAKKYGRAFHVSPAWLLVGEGKYEGSDEEVPSVPVVGEAAVGLWVDPEEVMIEDRDLVPAVPHPRYKWPSQFALKVRGSSMNRVAPDGWYVIAVPLPDGHIFSDGDVVSLRRERNGLVETTIKRYTRSEVDTVSFNPDSDDPRHQAPLKFDDDVDISITGICIGVFKALR